MKDQQTCPCGSQQAYSVCCGPLLSGEKPASTAEQLMRSRYSAYVINDPDYLLATWHDSSRPAKLELEQDNGHWLGLKIITRQAGQAGDSDGMVEFIARYKINGRAFRMHEKSRFVFENDRWFYLDGEQI